MVWACPGTFVVFVPKNGARSNFAARLKTQRLGAGLTQKALGVLIGLPEDVASTRINRYEKAVHDCELETAQKLADALRVPLASLYADNRRHGTGDRGTGRHARH